MTNGFDGGVLHLLRVTRAQCHASVAFAALRKDDGTLEITSLPSAEEGSDWPSSTLEGIVRQTLEDPLIGDSKAVIRVSDVFRRLWHGERVHTRMAVAPLNDETKGDEPWGLLCALGPSAGQFSETDLDMLGRLALRFMNQVRARRQIVQSQSVAEAESADIDEPAAADGSLVENSETQPTEPDTWFAAGSEPGAGEEPVTSPQAEAVDETTMPETPEATEPLGPDTPAYGEPERSDDAAPESESVEGFVQSGPTVESELFEEPEFFSTSGETVEGPSSASEHDLGELGEREQVGGTVEQEGTLEPGALEQDEQLSAPSAQEGELASAFEGDSGSGGAEELVTASTDGAGDVKEAGEAAEKKEMRTEDRIAALIEGPSIGGPEPATPEPEPSSGADGPERVAAFLRRLEEVLADARSSSSPAALIVIELSKESGSLSTDEVAAAANWLFTQTRFDDFVSRIATATFAIALPLRAMPQDLSTLRRRFSSAAAAAASELGEGVRSASSILPVEPGDGGGAEDVLFSAIRQLAED